MPDILNPPNGCRPTSAPVMPRFRYKLPTSNSRRARFKIRRDCAKTARRSARSRCRWRSRNASSKSRGANHRQHRPEDFFLRQPRVWQARRQKYAGRRKSLRRPADPTSTASTSRASLPAQLDVLPNALVAIRHRSPVRRSWPDLRPGRPSGCAPLRPAAPETHRKSLASTITREQAEHFCP